jgi:hypothetical protein
MYIKKNANVYPRSFQINLKQGYLLLRLLIYAFVLFCLSFSRNAVFQVVRVLFRSPHSGHFESP